MSFNTPKSSLNLHENQDNITLSDAFNALEVKFSETYKVSLTTIQELSKFIHEKNSLHIIDSSQEQLKRLQDFINASEISDEEKKVLSNIPNDSFQEFAKQVFTLRESISQQKHELKESIIGGDQQDFISCSAPLGISNARYIRACNPSKPHHHFESCIVGVYQLGYQGLKLTGSLCIDLAKACTIDSYNLLTGKAKLPDYNI